MIPANIDLSAAEVQLINEVGREQTLARALRPLLHTYDYILIDCQPSLGLLTVNALACANAVLMPLAAEFFSLRGVALLVDTVDKVKARINPDLEIGGVLVTMFDGRTVHAREVVAMLVQRFGDLVFDTVIARTVKFPETTVAGEPITSYAPTSAAAESYRAPHWPARSSPDDRAGEAADRGDDDRAAGHVMLDPASGSAARSGCSAPGPRGRRHILPRRSRDSG